MAPARRTLHHWYGHNAALVKNSNEETDVREMHRDGAHRLARIETGWRRVAASQRFERY